MSRRESSVMPELQMMIDFLQTSIPFDELPESQLFQLARAMEIQYFRRGHQFLNDKNCDAGLRLIRSGAAELRGADDQLIERIAEGESFNLQGLQTAEPGLRVVLIEDCLLYCLPEHNYQTLRDSSRVIDRFFHSQRSRRVRRAARYEPAPSDMLRKVGDVMAAQLVWVEPHQTIQASAQLMADARVSSLLVLEQMQVVGIVTDRDLRTRVVAQGLDVTLPVSDVMSENPATIKADASLFDATLLMTAQGYHHIPVMDETAVVGMLTASDLMLAKQDDPVYLVQHIRRQTSVEGMQSVVKQLPNLLVQWVHAGVRAYQVSKILTAVSDAVAQRLIDLALNELGPAPVPFAWLGFGSQGRCEQLLGADQDNGLLISDDFREEHRPWFQALATRVCDGLNACGYTYCKGEVMATTESWCQPLKVWCATVDRWTRTPTPDAVMRVSIFFDVRSIYGDKSLCDQLQQHMLNRAGSNSIFLAALAENVLDVPAPLGIFRRFLVERNGEHRDELNLKKRAVLPIVDSARIHSLADGITEVNTLARFQALAKAKKMTISDSRNLQDAWRVIMQIRLQQQASQVAAGQPVSNYLNPDDLSPLVRKQLKDAFTVVADAQSGVRQSYRAGLG